jgi:hypothetical protein
VPRAASSSSSPRSLLPLARADGHYATAFGYGCCSCRDRLSASATAPAVSLAVCATPLTRTPGAPLWAGPVQVEASRPAPQADSRDEEDVRLALLAALALRYLAWDRGRPW